MKKIKYNLLFIVLVLILSSSMVFVQVVEANQDVNNDASSFSTQSVVELQKELRELKELKINTENAAEAASLDTKIRNLEKRLRTLELEATE